MLKAESHLLDFNGEFVVLQQKDKYDKGKPFLINYYNHKLLKRRGRPYCFLMIVCSWKNMLPD